MKLNKFFKLAAVCSAAVMLAASVAFAEEAPVTVRVDNTVIEFDQDPVILDGRTLVPVRAVFEKAGAVVSWDQESQTASMVKDGYNVSIKLGEAFIIKNNSPIAIDVPSTIVNDRILIPVRAIAEAMDFGVTWNPVYRSVLIATDGKEYRPNAQWKSGFKSLKDHGFYVEASVSDLKFDLNSDEKTENITFTKSDTERAVLKIDGTDFSEVIAESCEMPSAIGVVDINKSDKFTEIMLVDTSSMPVTAYFYRYNGFDLFELKLVRDGVKGIEFNETLFFDGIENIISDLDGLCFLDTMVCPGIYSLEEDEIKRYYLDCENSVGMTFTPKYSDNMALNIAYTSAYAEGTYVNNAEAEAETIMIQNLPGSMKILAMYMDATNPANFEFFVEFSDGRTAVLWPYKV